MPVTARIIVIGPPGSGKTTLATKLGVETGWPVIHTDDLRRLEWSKQSDMVVGWMQNPGPWIIEGVAAIRAIRKWLRKPGETPCDTLYWLSTPKKELTKGQQTLATQCQAQFDEIRPMLSDVIVVKLP